MRDKRVVLGVTGGIAAYKAIELCRRLADAGAHVSPVLTEGALNFVTETTFSALAGEPAQTQLFGGLDPIPHTRLGQGADLVIVAPATARLIASYVSGLSDDLLMATLLATRAPVIVCPAMHTEMWEHPAVQANIATLVSRGVHIVGPEIGRLAGGDEGPGRLADLEVITAEAARILGPGDLEGVRVVVTAGGTREAIDPVRYIGNRSSGRQGHAIAAEAHSRGASVVLITAASIGTPPGVEVVPVTTAAEMLIAVEERLGADVVVKAAAVADFRPVSTSGQKIKKSSGVPELNLEPTTDILALVGKNKRVGQIVVGFAAETASVTTNALEKLRSKNADIMVANDVSAPGAGFEHETNAVTIHTADGQGRTISLRSKREVARSVLDVVVDLRGRL